MNEIKIKKVILYRVKKLKEKKIKNQEIFLSKKNDIDLIRQIDEILSDEIHFLIGLSQNLDNL